MTKVTTGPDTTCATPIASTCATPIAVDPEREIPGTCHSVDGIVVSADPGPWRESRGTSIYLVVIVSADLGPGPETEAKVDAETEATETGPETETSMLEVGS